MNSREKKKRDDAIKRLCFNGEDGFAYRLAEGIRNARQQGHDDEISMLILGSSSPRRWRLARCRVSAFDGARSNFYLAVRVSGIPRQKSVDSQDRFYARPV